MAFAAVGERTISVNVPPMSMPRRNLPPMNTDPGCRAHPDGARRQLRACAGDPRGGFPPTEDTPCCRRNPADPARAALPQLAGGHWPVRESASSLVRLLRAGSRMRMSARYSPRLPHDRAPPASAGWSCPALSCLPPLRAAVPPPDRHGSAPPRQMLPTVRDRGLGAELFRPGLCGRLGLLSLRPFSLWMLSLRLFRLRICRLGLLRLGLLGLRFVRLGLLAWAFSPEAALYLPASCQPAAYPLGLSRTALSAWALSACGL